jgi:hypothetical protein
VFEWFGQLKKIKVMQKYRVILKDGKVWSKLFTTPIQAIKEIGGSNILKLEEVSLIDLK